MHLLPSTFHEITFSTLMLSACSTYTEQNNALLNVNFQIRTRLFTII